jgi:hypothetical protein
MFNSAKISKIFVITLLSTVLLLSIVSPIASAQTQGTITILDSLGGSTDPAAGPTTSYAVGTAVTLTATPLDGYTFVQWVIVTATGSNVVTDNPYALTVSATDYAVQAIFDVVQQIPGGTPVTNFQTAAIVVVLAGAGGTTNPPPGTYALANADKLDLTAIPNSGWKFSNWIITGDLGSISGHTFTPTPTDNPYNVDHGYASQFNYQPVFIPIGSTTPTPTSGGGGTVGGLSMETVIIALVVVIVIVLIAFGVFAMRKKK